MTVSKLTYAWCQMTQRDGDGPEADAIALFTSTSGGDGRCAFNGGFLNGRARRLGPFSTAGARRLRAFVHYGSISHNRVKRDCGLSTSNLVETVTARFASRDTLSRSVGQLERK